MTEVFHLRSECAALGKKIEENQRKVNEKEFLNPNNTNPVVSAGTAKTNYSISANRCYVLLSTYGTKAEMTMLYDGQTEDTLAFTVKSTDGKPSRGFIGSLDGDIKAKEMDYSKVTDYINRLMDNGEPKQ